MKCPNPLCVDGFVETHPPCVTCAGQNAPCLFSCEVCGGIGDVSRELADAVNNTA